MSVRLQEKAPVHKNEARLIEEVDRIIAQYRHTGAVSSRFCIWSRKPTGIFRPKYRNVSRLRWICLYPKSRVL